MNQSHIEAIKYQIGINSFKVVFKRMDWKLVGNNPVEKLHDMVSGEMQ